MKKIHRFIKENITMSIFLFFSTIIVITYFIISSLKLLDEVKSLDILVQISIGYIINFIFFTTQVYIPNQKRNLTVRKCMYERIDKILRYMRYNITELTKIYNKNHTGNEYTEEDLDKLLKMRFSDKIKIVKANSTTPDNMEYFTVREWIFQCINRTEDGIDILYKYYASYITVNLMQTLEDILNSYYHEFMKTLLVVSGDVDFCHTKGLFSAYYRLICKLEEIKKSEYS